MKKFALSNIKFIVNCSLLLTFFSIHLNGQNQTIRWKQALNQKQEWYSGKEAIRIADNLLIFQEDNGGWPKNIDMARNLNKQEIRAIKTRQAKQSFSESTLDNRATHSQIKFLVKVYEQTGIERFKISLLKGVDYLLEAQYENGGWPQYYPIRKGYYEHITFNDGAMIGAMNLLREIANRRYDFVDNQRVEKSKLAIEKGLQVILKTQIKVNGELTAWCAQYNHKTLEPAHARSYELISISGAESVGIVQYLMTIENPNQAIITAVSSAVKWFEIVQLTDIRIIKQPDQSLPKGYDLVIGFDPANASQLWARFYEIGTNYPIFPNRDGKINYAFSELSHERRVGYRWLGVWPKKLKDEDYPKWQEKWNVIEK